MSVIFRIVGASGPMAGPAEHRFDGDGTIGRGADNDLVLADTEKFISSRHAAIEQRTDGYYLVDKSTNGTFVNNAEQPIGYGSSHLLREGDRIRIGEYDIQVTLDAEAIAPSTPPSWNPPPSQPEAQGGFPGDILGSGGSVDPLDHLPGGNAPPQQGGVGAPSAQEAGGFGNIIPPTATPDPALGRDPFASPGAPASDASPFPANPTPLGDPGSGDPFGVPQPPPAGSAPAAGGGIPEDWDKTSFGIDQAPAPSIPATPPFPGDAQQPAQPAAPAPGQGPQPPPSGVVPGPGGMEPVANDPFAPPPMAPGEPAAAPPGQMPPAAGQTAPPWPEQPTSPTGQPGALGQSTPGQSQPFPQAPAPQGATMPPAAPPPAPSATPPATPLPTNPMPPAPGQPGQANAAAPTAGNPFVDLLMASGLDPNSAAALGHPQNAQMLGWALRIALRGVMDVLAARAEIKNQFRVPLTRINAGENNPLKFCADEVDALQRLLSQQHGFMNPVDSFDEALRDIKAHQMAMMAGMRAAFDQLMSRFDPQRLEAEFDRHLGRGQFFQQNKSKYWDMLGEFHREITADSDANFQNLFGETFARAYEEQMARLSQPRGN